MVSDVSRSSSKTLFSAILEQSRVFLSPVISVEMIHLDWSKFAKILLCNGVSLFTRYVWTSHTILWNEFYMESYGRVLYHPFPRPCLHGKVLLFCTDLYHLYWLNPLCWHSHSGIWGAFCQFSLLLVKEFKLNWKKATQTGINVSTQGLYWQNYMDLGSHLSFFSTTFLMQTRPKTVLLTCPTLPCQ